MAEAIKVAVRVRPFNQREKDLKSELVVSMQGPNTTVMSDGKPKTFTYDFSYWSHTDESDPAYANQEKVMKDIGVVILNNALNGYNGCLFAYGQTGSGKSYSVMGYGDAPGIIPRSVDKIFEMKKNEEGDANKELRVWISYIEIYNEHIRDLLHAGNEPTELKVQDHPKLGVYIPDLTEVPCTAPGDVTKLMDFGTKKRVVAATQMNATSSRSHAVFTVKVQFLEGAKPEPDKKDERKCLNAKINLVDLAGSERSSKTGAEGATLKEGCAINQSLSALGMVIKELSESMAKKGGKGGVVPFRASKLTFLLKDSLAGNSKTYMIAALSPASDNKEETISTLRFASSVKSIKTVAIQNKDKKDELIEQLQEEIKRMKEQGMIAGDGEGGGGGGGISVEEREKMVAELKQSFEDQIKTSEKMEEARKEALDDGGLSHDEINQAFGVDSNTPYLLNMADDPMLAGCLLYIVKEGEPTTVGSTKENTITLQGIGIPEELCKIENKANKEVTITKLSSKGRVVVNGKLLNEGIVTQLTHNDKIFLGRAYALKLTLPCAATANAEDTGLSLEGLEDECAALDDSPSWGGLQMYLDQILQQMPKDQAKTLFDDVKECCKMCDEANDITAECRGEEGFLFEVDLTSSIPSSVVIRVLYSQEGSEADPSTFEPLYLWPVWTMKERLERMRDAHEQFSRKGSHDIDTLSDPWHETKQHDIDTRITEMESAMHELQEELAQLKNEKIAKLQKAMMAWSTGKSDVLIANCFRAWATYTGSVRKSSRKAPPRRSVSMAQSLKRANSMKTDDTPASSTSTAKAATPKASAKSEPAPKSKAGATAGPAAKAKSTAAKAKATATKDDAKAPASATGAPPEFTPSEGTDVQPATAIPVPASPEKVDNHSSIAPEWAGPPSQPASEASPTAPAAKAGSPSTAGRLPSRPMAAVKNTKEEAKALTAEVHCLVTENDTLREQLDAAWQLCSVLRTRLDDHSVEVTQLGNECNRLRQDRVIATSGTVVPTMMSAPRFITDPRLVEISGSPVRRAPGTVIVRECSPPVRGRSPSTGASIRIRSPSTGGGDLYRALSQTELAAAFSQAQTPRGPSENSVMLSASSGAIVGAPTGPVVIPQGAPLSMSVQQGQFPPTSLTTSMQGSPLSATIVRQVGASTTPVKGTTYVTRARSRPAPFAFEGSVAQDRPLTARG